MTGEDINNNNHPDENPDENPDPKNAPKEPSQAKAQPNQNQLEDPNLGSSVISVVDMPNLTDIGGNPDGGYYDSSLAIMSGRALAAQTTAKNAQGLSSEKPNVHILRGGEGESQAREGEEKPQDRPGQS